MKSIAHTTTNRLVRALSRPCAMYTTRTSGLAISTTCRGGLGVIGVSLGLNGERHARGINNLLRFFRFRRLHVDSCFRFLPTDDCVSQTKMAALARGRVRTKRVRHDVADGMSRGKSNCRRDLRKARHCSPRVATPVVRVAAVAFSPLSLSRVVHTERAQPATRRRCWDRESVRGLSRIFRDLDTRRADSLDLSAPATHVASAAPRSPGDHAQAQAQAVAR